MKGRSLFGLIVSLAVLGVESLPVLAQSQRYPTSTEMQRLRQEFRQLIRLTQTDQVGANYIQDRRTQAQRQNRESFVRAWSNIEPEAAPFLVPGQDMKRVGIFILQISEVACVLLRLGKVMAA